MTNKLHLFVVSFVLVMSSSSLSAQKFSRQDSLRGGLTPQRVWWDLNHYDLKVAVDPEKRYIKGSNTITYTPLKKGQNELQLDLQAPMTIVQASQSGSTLKVRSEGSAHFIQLESPIVVGTPSQLTISFEGAPRVAQNAPWDGGWVWKKDQNGNPFIATANQGIGSSVWWPNKDHPADEVDSLAISINVPKDLTAVSNGRLTTVETTATTKTYHWKVVNPINNYGVNINIGDYVHFDEIYKGEKGALDMDYWVLRDDLAKAQKQFAQAPMMMAAFEHWFGPYPFYEDSFKLVQVPYLGMEHQSSVTYGNQFKNGYLGRDLSRSGWGLKFDFIIIHEAGHEWFANNITNNDVADMWIHEGFTAYSEGLYLDYHYGKQAAREYVLGTRAMVQNDRPVIGQYKVNHRGSGDMYYKGANILHMLRTIAQDDKVWRSILRGLNKDFYHQTVSSQRVEDYIAAALGLDLSPFFDQYLRTNKIPTLEYRLTKNGIAHRFTNVIPNFTMPLDLRIDKKNYRITPTSQWQVTPLDQKPKKVSLPADYYVTLSKG